MREATILGLDDADRNVGATQTIEAKHGSDLALHFAAAAVRQDDHTAGRRHHFKYEIQQPLLQFFDATYGIDRGADFHQRAQVTRHHKQRIVKFELQG